MEGFKTDLSIQINALDINENNNEEESKLCYNIK